MGLFDILTGNASPEVSAGLLGMGTKLLQASGPSRMPVNTMLALAEGAQGFQQGRDDYLDRQRQKQMQDLQFKLLGLKVQDVEGESEKNARILARLQGLDELPKLADKGEPQAGGEPDAAAAGSPFMQRMAAMGSSAPAAGRYGAQAYHDAALQAGLPNPGSMETSNAIIDRVNRFGETPDMAARAVTGMGGAGTSAGPASIFAAGDGAQFPSTTSLLAGLPGLPKRLDADAAPAGQQLPFLPSTMRQGGAAVRQNATQRAVEKMLARADIYASEGDHAAAAKIYDDVAKLRPKVKELREVQQGGHVLYAPIFEDGTPGELIPYEAAVKLASANTGGSTELYHPITGKSVRTIANTQSPDSRAVDRRFAARAAAGPGGEPSMDSATLDVLADQALRGDTSVYQNLGRGAQGAANLIALRTRVAQKALGQGLTGGDIASINADYQGQKAGLRTSGTISARIENAASEAAELAPLAIQASRSVVRSGLLPFGKADVMFDTQTNDPAMSQFATANIGLATAYAGAMARGGKATVSDMQHAREILSTAKSQPAYEATVSQMQQEIAAAQRAPQNVRNNLRGQINGRGGSHDTPTVPNPMAPGAGEQFTVTAPNGKTYTFPDRKSMNNFKLSTGIR